MHVFGRLGRAPREGDAVEHDGLRFQIVEIEGSRIERLQVEFLPAPVAGEAPAAGQRSAEA